MPESARRPAVAEFVAVAFATRREADRALGDLIERLDSGEIAVESAAVVRATVLGGHRVRHGLPLTRAELVEMRLLTIAPMAGAAVDLPPRHTRPRGRPGPRNRVPEPALQAATAVLPRGGVAIVVTSAADAAEILGLLGRGRVAGIRTNLPDGDERRLRKALLTPAR